MRTTGCLQGASSLPPGAHWQSLCQQAGCVAILVALSLVLGATSAHNAARSRRLIRRCISIKSQASWTEVNLALRITHPLRSEGSNCQIEAEGKRYADI